MENKKIEILSDNLINKIAAGEVVEKPISVVKELVENSLDADAKNITIVIENGGKSLIEIIDDGFGMDEDSLILAFERHATSKVKSYEDVINVSSMGFRGEALPSIAAVSKLECTSKKRGAEDGFKIGINGGVIADVKPSPFRLSTKISVKSLFFNIPARKKYLKDAKKEYAYIYSYFKKVALSRPDVGFSLVNNGKTIFDLKEQSLSERLSVLFREVNNENLIEVKGRYQNYKIYGFIGSKELSRRTKDNQFLLVNNRIVQNNIVSYAVYKSYNHIIEPGYYPYFVLFIDLPPQKVDVNVHPSKNEVKFFEENIIRALVLNSASDALKQQLSIVSLDFSSGNDSSDSISNANDDPLVTLTNKAFLEPIPKSKEKQSMLFKVEKIGNDDVSTQENLEISKTDTIVSEDKNRYFKPPRTGADILKLGNESVVSESVWQFHKKYIIAEIESGMLIIDQHVAQERIFFEKALNIFSNKKMDSQILLFPVKIELSFEDKLGLEEIKTYLNDVGFEIAFFGKNTYIIEGVPAFIKNGEEEKTILGIIDNYKIYREKKMSVMEAVAASYACKRAIKAGQELNKDEMLSLINQLFMCKFPHVCPHGRPVIVNLTTRELDKKFLRIK